MATARGFREMSGLRAANDAALVTDLEGKIIPKQLNTALSGDKCSSGTGRNQASSWLFDCCQFKGPNILQLAKKVNVERTPRKVKKIY